MRKIYTSIDIGTDEIKAITVEEYNDKINVLATSNVPSKGVKRGLIVDASAVSSAIKKAIKTLESKLGTKVNQVLAIIPSNNMDINIGVGYVETTRDDSIIDGEMIFNALQKCLKDNVSKTMEVVGMMPIEYKIDNIRKVSNPLGLEGKSLEVKSVIVSVPQKNVYSVVSILENIGIEVIDVTISSIADYYSIKDKEHDKEIVSVINIGKEKSVVSVFNKGIIIKEKIVSLGGDDLDEVIDINYKLGDNSKHVKEEYGVSNRKYADGDEEYPVIDSFGHQISINQYNLSEILEQKLVSMLKNMKNEINNLTNREISYIIITGALCSMLGFNALVEDTYGSKGRILNTNVIGIRDNKFSSCYGAVLCFIEKLNLREKEYTMFIDEKVDEMLKARKRIGNGSVLGKIFGKIFD